jgi:hypothetical protein
VKSELDDVFGLGDGDVLPLRGFQHCYPRLSMRSG